MAVRYWLSGPRTLNGFVRPGICFYARDLKRRPPGPIASKSVALLYVLTRADGAVTLGGIRRPRPMAWKRRPI